MTWVEELPNNNSPTWMGLSASAENVILEHKGKSVLKKLFMIQDAAAIVGTSAGKEDGDDNEGQNSASDKNKTLNSTIFQKCSDEVQASNGKIEIYFIRQFDFNSRL